MNSYTNKFWRKFFQSLLVGVSAMVLLLAGQQGLFTSPKISNFTFAQSEDDGSTTSGNSGTLPDDGNTIPGDSGTLPDDGNTIAGNSGTLPAPTCSAGNEGQDGSGCYTWMNCSDGTGYPEYHVCSGDSSAAAEPAPAAPAQPAVPAAPTVVSGGGECIDGRMHWVNYLSDGSRDVDSTANEYCEGSGTNAQIVSAPAESGAQQAAQSGLNCEPGTPLNTCSDSVGAGHTYCVWDAAGNYESDCKIEACHSGTKAPPACVADLVSGGNASSQWQCERDIAAGIPTCTDNITFCEDTGPNQSTIFLKRSGACNPALQEADSRGCIFYHEPIQFQNFACGGQLQQPAQPAAPVTPAVAERGVQQTCYVCDNTGFADGQGRWRVDGNGCPANPPFCQANNSATFAGCLNATVGAICETRQAPPVNPPVVPPVVTPPAQGGNTTITVNPNITSTNTNSNTNTVTNTVTDRVLQREVVREVEAPKTFGNVGVGTTVVQPQVIYTQGVQYAPQALPKTGLPELAWSALAFIPTGFGLRKFSKVKKALENYPSYIWEERQFKA